MRLREHWRTLRWSAWLGWQMESNWTEPWLFAIYVLIKPVTGSFLLVCMYFAARTATAQPAPQGFLPFLYVSNACYMLVGAVAFGMSWAVIMDREHYGMLKYICISPARLRSYFVGRGLARAGEACLGAVLTLAIGLIFPEMRQALGRHGIDWGWLAVYLLTGIVMLVALGLILAAAVLNMARQAMFLSEGVAGTLYLLSGAVFPIDVLPRWLHAVSLALPTTYWLEGMRRALLGPSDLPGPLGQPPLLSSLTAEQIALRLVLSTVALVVAGHFFFAWSERQAWRKGKFDETTGF